MNIEVGGSHTFNSFN